MKGPALREHVNLRMMPGQRDRINELILENPERWKYEAEFLRAAIHHYLMTFQDGPQRAA